MPVVFSSKGWAIKVDATSTELDEEFVAHCTDERQCFELEALGDLDPAHPPWAELVIR
jgi:hypothetical protein